MTAAVRGAHSAWSGDLHCRDLAPPQAGAKMVERVLVVPAAHVGRHMLELHQELVQTSGAIIRLELDERTHHLDARRSIGRS